ncbi:MAG: hypothetical protein WAJ97_03430 [Terriglobales bacterium]|jgi:hypothetical protein
MPYTFRMRTESVDISQYSFDEFITFLFDRDWPPETEKFDPWYWHTDVIYAPDLICGYYVRLFQESQFLQERFSKLQIEEGFWAIQVPNLDCSAFRIMWEPDLPFAVREECVRTMADLFKNLFAAEPLDTSVQMWWDSLCYDWHCGNRARERGGEDERMQDVIFQTLTAILALDSDICQKAALHGLGHLHHPETENLITSYIAQHPDLSKEQHEYALAAAKFEVQ